MKNRFFPITIAILAVGLFVTSNVRAEDGPPPDVQPQAEPQAQTAAGRISVIHGDVTTMHGDAGEWAPGTVNTPVVPGDKVATADQSRAEVQLDSANVMRLDQHTEAKVADLEQNKIQIQLASGLIDYSVSNGTQADAEIDTPNMGVHPLSPGVYRIQVNSPTETLLIVRQGQAEVLTDQGSTKVEAGQVIQIHGSDNPEYKIDPAPGGDEFDKWCNDRNRQMRTAQSLQHTDPQYTGSSDLDNYGQWNEVPDYGWCWTPQVDAGWVPYSAGNWGWEPYWGWTWISAEPWGWAPYHYGRWFMYGGAWRWWPARGMGFGWSPAYVSFFGFGRGLGVGVGFGFGSIGWLPLGPRDIFHPWFGRGHSFGALGFNEMHGAGFIHPGGPRYGSNLETMMTDAHVRNAFRSVSSQAFASGRMSHSMPVSEGMMRNASVMRGNLPVAPSRSTFSSRGGSFAPSRSGSASGQHFFSRSGAPAAGRSYTMTGRPGGNTESSGARSNSMAPGRAAAPGGGGSNYNWQRYASGNTAGRPPNTGFQGRTSGAPQGNQPSWQRFASPSPYSGRTGSNSNTQRGGWQGYNSQPRSYSGGGMASTAVHGMDSTHMQTRALRVVTLTPTT